MTSLNLNVMTYNICNVHPSVIERAGASPEKYSWLARKERIFSVIQDAMPTFLCCQEIRDYEIEGRIVKLEGDFYKAIGGDEYDIVTASNNADRWSFRILTAFKTDKYFLSGIYKWWNNSINPERFGDTCGNAFGRVSLMCKFLPVIEVPTKDGKGVVRQPDYDGLPVYVVNTHPGLKHAERQQHHQILMEQTHRIIGDEKAVLVVMGDFNCYPDDNGDEELACYKAAGFIGVDELKSSEGLPVEGTFAGYPEYDKFVPPKGTLGSQLDQVWFKPMNMEMDISYKATVDLKRHDGEDQPRTSIAECLTDPITNEDLRHKLPSDHLPIHVKAVLQEKKNK